jgi:uncharacterized protein (TIGR03083 family)
MNEDQLEVTLDKRAYLQAFDDNWRRLLAAAELGMDSLVPSCPGWSVGALIGHMGSVFTFWNKWVRDRPRGGWDDATVAELRAERDARLPGFSAWRDNNFAWEAAPPGVVEFAKQTQAELAGRLAELDPSEPVWTFFEPNQTAGFVQRRIAHETAVHCWDAQAAQGIAEPIPAELAKDGVDEYVDAIIHVNRESLKYEGKLPTFSGERYAFHRSDGDGDWLVEIAPEEIRASRSTEPADVTIAGPVSDLNLFMYNRVPLDRLEVTGDATLLDRWAELAGAF